MDDIENERENYVEAITSFCNSSNCWIPFLPSANIAAAAKPPTSKPSAKSGATTKPATTKPTKPVEGSATAAKPSQKPPEVDIKTKL